MPRLEFAELVLTADLHRHIGGQIRIDRRRQHVIKWRQHRGSIHEQQREILGVCVMIADQGIEDHVVEQAQNLRCAGAGNPSNQVETLPQPRATFILVFRLRHHAQRLTKILLVQTPSKTLCICLPVVTLDHQEPSPRQRMHS
ncbi:hypothetical protein SDC9_176515 [bioreactor metagenome]|uniref:Uncharacterized protein n=1 Tax=bioreactor metagenome TaxID=1076179 RepID=A0A645GQA1_9ZZZZ